MTSSSMKSKNNPMTECHKNKLKTAIVGSRDFNDYSFMKEMLKHFNISSIISGGAIGADTLANRYAIEYNIPITIIRPNWYPNKEKKHIDKGAGIKRNLSIVEKAEQIIAFWNGKSPGTKSTIQFAKQQNKPYYIFWPSFDDELKQIGKI